MPKIAFNETNIDAISVRKTTWYSDTNKKKVRGLRLMAGPIKKTWFLNRRAPDGKVRQVKLGEYPDMNVELARITANGTRLNVPDLTLTRAPTLQDHLDEYIKAHRKAGSLSARTEDDYRRLFEGHARDVDKDDDPDDETSWLDKPLSALTTYMVEARFNTLHDRPGVANKLITVLRSVNTYAQRHDEIKRDPTTAVTNLYALKRRTVRCEDLALVMQDILGVENPVKRTAWQLLLHTGLRTSNLRSMRWENVDLEKKTMFHERLKTTQNVTLPLSDHSVALFEEVRPYHDEWCFPSLRGSRSGHIDHLDAQPHVTQHCCRRHFSSVATRIGIERDVRKFLRGDVTREDAIDHYLYSVGTHETVNKISARLNAEAGIKV